MSAAKVVAGFVSFTEVEPGAHGSYNEWHLFDHMPEQLPLPGIVWGQRWVLTPALRARAVLTEPLDRVHYVTLYLMAEPLEQTIDDFFALAGELRRLGRFHEKRTAHLSGPLALVDMAAAEGALVRPEAVPYRPNRGVHVRVERTPAGAPPPFAAVDGAAGRWVFEGTEAVSRPETIGRRITVTWLDGPATIASAPGADFDATLEPVDPWGPWDWFD